MKQMVFICILSVIAISTAMGADKPTTPLDEFEHETNKIGGDCDYAALHLYNTAYAENKSIFDVSADGITKCNLSAQSVKKSYLRVKQYLAKNPTALNAFKDYYAAWLMAIDGVDPVVPQSNSAYLDVQIDNRRRVKEKWIRFELEME